MWQSYCRYLIDFTNRTEFVKQILVFKIENKNDVGIMPSIQFFIRHITVQALNLLKECQFLY